MPTTINKFPSLRFWVQFYWCLPMRLNIILRTEASNLEEVSASLVNLGPWRAHTCTNKKNPLGQVVTECSEVEGAALALSRCVTVSPLMRMPSRRERSLDSHSSLRPLRRPPHGNQRTIVGQSNLTCSAFKAWAPTSPKTTVWGKIWHLCVRVFVLGSRGMVFAESGLSSHDNKPAIKEPHDFPTTENSGVSSAHL